MNKDSPVRESALLVRAREIMHFYYYLPTNKRDEHDLVLCKNPNVLFCTSDVPQKGVSIVPVLKILYKGL